MTCKLPRREYLNTSPTSITIIKRSFAWLILPEYFRLVTVMHVVKQNVYHFCFYIIAPRFLISSYINVPRFSNSLFLFFTPCHLFSIFFFFFVLFLISLHSRCFPSDAKQKTSLPLFSFFGSFFFYSFSYSPPHSSVRACNCSRGTRQKGKKQECHDNSE